MLDYNDFMLVEKFEKELDTLIVNENMSINEDLFHPIKTKRIKKALKDYTKAEVEIARADVEKEKRLEKVDDKGAREKLSKALDRKKQVAQERINQVDDTLSANATTDALQDLVTYGKAAAKEKALNIRAKAEENDARKAELEDQEKKQQEAMKKAKEEIEAAKKAEAEKQNNGSGNGENK